MTDWTEIPDANVEVGKPTRSIDGLALRDNVPAAFEKAVGAPVLANDYVVEAMISALAVTNVKLSASAVTWGKISTSLQQSSGTTVTGTPTDIGFTGGGQTLGWSVAWGSSNASHALQPYNNGGYVFGVRWWNATGGNLTYYFQANYINSSPPWNMGDGDIELFVFLEIQPDGTVLRVDVADAPPWGYNGPTSVVPSRETADGRKYRRVRQLIAEHGTLAAARLAGLTRAQIFDRLATDPWVDEVITAAIKNRDMPLIPHPFGAKQAPANTIVLLDPVSPLVQQLAALHADAALDERLSDLLLSGAFEIGNTPLARAVPPGVLAVAARWKLTP